MSTSPVANPVLWEPGDEIPPGHPASLISRRLRPPRRGHVGSGAGAVALSGTRYRSHFPGLPPLTASLGWPWPGRLVSSPTDSIEVYRRQGVHRRAPFPSVSSRTRLMVGTSPPRCQFFWSFYEVAPARQRAKVTRRIRCVTVLRAQQHRPPHSRRVRQCGRHLSALTQFQCQYQVQLR